MTIRRRKPTFEIRKAFSNNGITLCVSLPAAVASYIELAARDQVGVWQKVGGASIELKDGDIIIRKIQEEE